MYIMDNRVIDPKIIPNATPEMDELKACLQLWPYSRFHQTYLSRFKYSKTCPMCEMDPTARHTTEARCASPPDCVQYESFRPRNIPCCKHSDYLNVRSAPICNKNCKTDHRGVCHEPSEDAPPGRRAATTTKFIEASIRNGFSHDPVKRSHFTSPIRSLNRENNSPRDSINFLCGHGDNVCFRKVDNDKSPTRKILEESIDTNTNQSTFRKILDGSPTMIKGSKRYYDRDSEKCPKHHMDSPVMTRCGNIACNGIEPLKETHITKTGVSLETRYVEEVKLLRGKLREITEQSVPTIHDDQSVEKHKNLSPSHEPIEFIKRSSPVKTTSEWVQQQAHAIVNNGIAKNLKDDIRYQNGVGLGDNYLKNLKRTKSGTHKVRHTRSKTAASILSESDSSSDDEPVDDSHERCDSTDLNQSELAAIKNELRSLMSSNHQAVTDSGDNNIPKSLLRPSLFSNVPPYLLFASHECQGPKIPNSVQRQLKWRLSNITPMIVRKILTNTGFRLIRNDTNKVIEVNDWIGVWGKHIKSPLFRQLKDFQKMNHFPGTFQLGRKDRLWRNAQRLQMKYGLKEFDFIPKTYILPQDIRHLRHSWEKGEGEIKWILKPPASARGTGIRVVNKWVQIPKKKPLVVQKYIDNPYLINGSKFDLRLYVLLTSVDPLRIYLYPDGLARFASVKYSSDPNTLENRYIHLTNYSINKLSKDYTANEDANACQGHKWTIQTLWEYLRKEGVNTDALWANLQDLVIRTMICGESGITQLVRSNVASRYNCYELFGVDVLLDENLKPWLLEVNISPSLHSSSPLDTYVKGPLVQSLLNMAQYHIPVDKFSPTQRNHVINCLGLRKTKSYSAGVNAQNSDFSNRPHTVEGDSVHGRSPKRRERRASVQEVPLCYDPRMYSTVLTKNERQKQEEMISYEIREEYLEDILSSLTPDDVRHLVIAEDELQVAGDFQRIFPTSSSYQYMSFMEPRYYDRLFDAWENKYQGNREEGIRLLESFCTKKYHLIVAPPTKLFKEAQSNPVSKEEAQAKTTAMAPGQGVTVDKTCDGPSPNRKPSGPKAVLYRAARTRTGRVSIILKPFPRSYYFSRVLYTRRRRTRQTS